MFTRLYRHSSNSGIPMKAGVSDNNFCCVDSHITPSCFDQGMQPRKSASPKDKYKDQASIVAFSLGWGQPRNCPSVHRGPRTSRFVWYLCLCPFSKSIRFVIMSGIYPHRLLYIHEGITGVINDREIPSVYSSTWRKWDEVFPERIGVRQLKVWVIIRDKL